MYKVMRKISILIFVAWFAICAVYVYPQRKAEAFLPAILAAPYVAPVVCALVAAGATFLTVAAAENAAQWFYSSSADNVRTEINNMSETAVSTAAKAVVVTDLVWEGIKNFYRPDIGDATKADVAWGMGELKSIQATVPVTNTSYNAELHYNDKTYYYYAKEYVNGSNVYMRIYKSDNPSSYIHQVYVSASGERVDKYNLARNISTNQIGFTSILKLNGGVYSATWSGTYEYGTSAGTQTESRAVPYTGAGGFLDNPVFDPAAEGEQRKFGVPTGDLTIDNLIGKTFTDVDQTSADPIDPPVDPPADTTFDGTTEITGLSSVFNAIKTMSANIAKFFDLTTPVNLEPLRVTGDIFTTRFPFSLPWDLMRSFQLFNDNTFNPVLNINIPKGPILPNLNFNLDLSVWSDIVGYIKALELLIFDITLVLMTRKLLGGGV